MKKEVEEEEEGTEEIHKNTYEQTPEDLLVYDLGICWTTYYYCYTMCWRTA